MNKKTERIFLRTSVTKIVLFVAVIGLIIPVPGFSKPTEVAPAITAASSLQDLTAAAIERNPGLNSAKEQWQAALEQIPQVKALPNPQLSIAHFLQSVETRVGPQRQKLGLMQLFPWFGKLKLKGNAALQAAEAKRQLFEQKKLEIVYRVREVWYEYAFAVQRIEILKKNIRLLEYLEEVVRERYRTGMASYPSLLQIQVEKEKLTDRLASASENLRPLRARLNAVLNRPFQAVLPVPENTPALLPGMGEISYEKLEKGARQENPGLKAIGAVAEKEKTAIRLARKNYYPDFSIGVDYILTARSDMYGIDESGKDPVAAKISLSLPIWGKKNRAAVNEARLRHRAALNRAKNMENQLLARLELIYYRFKDARRKVQLYKNTLLPHAQQALEVTRAAFENNKAPFAQFIDAQRTVLAFQLELERAKSRQAQRFAELMSVAGSSNRDFTAEATKWMVPDRHTNAFPKGE